jgi:D-beta-D-heptose 7-phosphate kinase/D-beta-D-heptose 1-phosphate adenosyltransferase
VQSLQAARSLGDCLVVAVNSDTSVRELKGPSRPIIDERNRAEMLAALSCVDFVILFDDASVARLVREIRPDVLVKAAEYSVQGVVGHEIVEEYGGEVVVVPMKGGYSTTALIERIRGEGTLSLRKAS